jgi:ubiquinone/menaquinone biosynthesis C-methylase UbiE
MTEHDEPQWEMAPGNEWEQEAENWLRWARAPGHDAYWLYRDAFFDSIVPPPGHRTLELGCGEGRVTRDLLDRGHRVTAVDLSPTLLAHAHAADPRADYIVADAARLPFATATFDVVVSYNSLMDIADMAGAVREAARVLVACGRFCICVTHPMSDAGTFASGAADAPFTIAGKYFGRRRFEGTFERNGLTMTFRGWCRSLEDYAKTLEDARLVVETLREPVPAGAPPHYERWQRIPMFLHLRVMKPDLTPSSPAPRAARGPRA